MGTAERVAGGILANNVQHARHQLKQQQIAVEKLKIFRGRKVKKEDIVVLTQQFAVMVRSSLPILQIFDLLQQSQSNPYLQWVLSQIKDDVEQGQALAQALGRYPEYFDSFYCGVVAAGELGGVLDQVLDDLAHTLEQSQTLKRQVSKALSYPLTVLVMALLLITVMMVFVLPEFEHVYQSVGASLPWLTQVLITVSRNMPYILPVGVIFGVVVYYSLRTHYRHSARFRMACEQKIFRLPLLGHIWQQSLQANLLRTLAVLFAAGVPLSEALTAIGKMGKNETYRTAIQKIRSNIMQGQSLSQAMQETEKFDILVIHMTKVGEESGRLDQLLFQTAQLQENEIQHRISMATTLLEPMMMLILGVIVGILLLALYWPLFQLGNVLR